jgi:hypothetical protein
MRAAPGSAHGAIVVNCFKSCDVEQWLVADADNGKALTVCRFVAVFMHFISSRLMLSWRSLPSNAPTSALTQSFSVQARVCSTTSRRFR